jgi:hypothetical protein
MPDLRRKALQICDATDQHCEAAPPPGLLRLATETRLEIFEMLLSEDKCKSVYGIPEYEGMVWISRKFFGMFPLTRVCRRLRYEAIPVFYGRFRWMVDFLMPRRYYVRWLRTIDPYALQCMKGVTLEHFTHRCPVGSLAWDGRIDLDFDCKPVTVKVVNERQATCCTGELANREKRALLAEEFAADIESDRRRTKEILMELLMQIEDVGRKVRA